MLKMKFGFFTSMVVVMTMIILVAIAPGDDASPASNAWHGTGNGVPPNPPIIDGPSTGRPWDVYTYNITLIHPDNHQMERLEVYFGDDKEEILNCGCTQPYWESGEILTLTHRWTQRGEYIVRARVRDVYGLWSENGTLDVSMPLPSSASLNDSLAPEIRVLNPDEGYIHFGGIPLIKNPLPFITPTLIPGGFLFETGKALITDNVDASENIVLDIYLDNEHRATAPWSPCSHYHEWGGLGPGFGVKTLRLVAEDNSGNVGTAEMQVFYFCMLPA